MNKVKMYIMANDAKWVMNIRDLSFVPFSGMDFEGLAGEQSLRVSGMSYDVTENFFKVRLAWLSAEPMLSRELIDLNIGWEMAAK
jgi:hypothetical protein